MKKNQSITFNLQEIAFKDLAGRTIKLEFDHKEFGNLLFAHAQNIEMDEFARQLFKEGKGSTNAEILKQIISVVEQNNFTFRAKMAITEYIDSLI